MTGEAAREAPGGATAVLRNRLFLFLWLAQVATQIGANMVLYALVVMVREATDLNSAVAVLFLTFLMPSVLFSALAGVYVDRFDRRWVLVITNLLRATFLVAIFLAGGNITVVLVFNIIFATVTVFFAPAEAAMIPKVVPRDQLIAANGLFTLTLNGAFALGFAFLGPLIVTIVGGPQPVILAVAVLYAIAATLCLTQPTDKPSPRSGGSLRGEIGEAGQAVGGTFQQLRDGAAYIRANRSIAWSLTYLGIVASLVGILGVLGPGFAQDTLGLSPKDLIVVVLPLGLGIVMGVLVLNAYGKLVTRRHAIEAGLITLGVLLVLLTVAGPVSRFLTGVGNRVEIVDLASVTSLVGVVVAIAFLAGVAYGIVAISSQTQLQEDIVEEARGRVFGVLNMLISVASILPIIIVGSIADLIGTTAVILTVAVLVLLSGVASIVARAPEHEGPRGSEIVGGIAVDGIGVTIRAPEGDRPSRPVGGPEPGSGL
ncbi:MAG TPA: MFS transporter [Candidatus Limnocylindrales bacterium]|nr:MFS transporter [Candidatus Limnocylindrales bacterium]